MTRIKVCGITNAEDAMLAVALGADAVGFVFADSPRRIDVSPAREIIGGLPPFVGRVGVFVNEAPEVIRDTVACCGLDAVQLHGDEDPRYVRSFGFPVIKTFRVNRYSVIGEIRRYGLTHFLLDTYIPDRAGGTGTSFDWKIAREAAALGQVILSGGLNAENVAAALACVHPYAVDVCSGVEAYPGKKDSRKLESFIREVRLWDSRID